MLTYVSSPQSVTACCGKAQIWLSRKRQSEQGGTKKKSLAICEKTNFAAVYVQTDDYEQQTEFHPRLLTT